MNLGDVRSIVRRELHDEDEENYRWSDNELNRHIARAVQELSEYYPRQQTADSATINGERAITLSLEGMITLDAVEYPIGLFPRQFQRFSLWNNILTLLGPQIPDGSDARLYYGIMHTLDEEGSSLAERFGQLVATGAEGFAAIEQAIYTVNRVTTGGSSSFNGFLQWGRERITCFRSELTRLSRRNRIRTGQLYVPFRPPVSKTTVYGP